MARNLFIKILCMYNKTKKTTLLNSNNETATLYTWSTGHSIHRGS